MLQVLQPVPYTVRAQVGIVLIFGLWDVSAFCPAGFDDEGDADSGTNQAPFEFGDQRWQCARERDSNGRILFDQHCLDEIQDKGFVQSLGQESDMLAEDGKICDWYWGNDEGEDGYWDRMTGEFGVAYWECYSSGKAELIDQFGSEAVSGWPQDRMDLARMEIDKRCVSSELCATERSAKGWCSDFYREKVMPDCGAEDTYTVKYCTEICPPTAHEDFFADLDDDDEVEDMELLEEPLKATFPPPRPSKCPVIRGANFVKDKAKDIGKAAWKILYSLMPSLLMPPEPVSSSEDARSRVASARVAPAVTSPVLPVSVSIR